LFLECPPGLDSFDRNHCLPRSTRLISKFDWRSLLLSQKIPDVHCLGLDTVFAPGVSEAYRRVTEPPLVLDRSFSSTQSSCWSSPVLRHLHMPNKLRQCRLPRLGNGFLLLYWLLDSGSCHVGRQLQIVESQST
jgi:hypothetical protein